MDKDTSLEDRIKAHWTAVKTARLNKREPRKQVWYYIPQDRLVLASNVKLNPKEFVLIGIL